MNQNSTIPPKLATKLLNSFLRDDLREDVTGDLQENFEFNMASGSRLRAQVNYWWEVLLYLRPFAVRKIERIYSNPLPMYRSYFKTAFRGMVRNKLHAFINILGLATGMAVALVIGLWIKDELSYEKGFPNYGTIAQVIQNVTNNGEVETWDAVPFPLAEELRQNYHGDFDKIVMTSFSGERRLSTEEHLFLKRGLYAEPDFPDLLSMRFVRGSGSVLKDPSSILLSSSAAKAYFGESDPIGKIMTIGGRLTVHVGGVYEDMPDHSEFEGLDFVAPWELFYNGNQLNQETEPWRPNAYLLYVQLAERATFESASLRIRDAKLKKVGEELAKKKPQLFLHPMMDWHLRGEFKNGKQAGGRIQYVWMFGIIGSFVVLMACINFMNLSTARSEKRAKEVGIRKAVGSHRTHLVTQFFSESILTTIVSIFASMVIGALMLPFFNQIAEKKMSIPWAEPLFWIGALSFSIIIGLIAGSYPALYLSSIKSVGALKGLYKAGKAAALPRKILVVAQFSISVTMIIGTTIVFLQINHGKDRPVGYSVNGLISIPVRSQQVHLHYDAIREELLNESAILEMAETVAPPTSSWGSTSRITWTGKDPELSVDFAQFGASIDYGKTIDWEVIDGRDFSRDHPSDSQAFIVNEAAVKYMNLKNPVGETVMWRDLPYPIVGVIRNIVYQSPYEPVRPSLYFLTSDGQSNLILRINPSASATTAVAKIEEVVKRHTPGEPFSYQFVDDQYGRKFSNEERIGTLASAFAVLAIFISCLGIFGLSSFIAEQRTKEIGLRKVMGASLYELWVLISRDFMFLVIISCVIAVPVSGLLLQSWLEGYEYRIDLPWWTFVAAAIGTLLITLITVSWHTVSAARMNPVNSLRVE